MRAHHVLAVISRLYEVERAASEVDAMTRRALRQEHAGPLLQEMQHWLEAEEFLPKSLIGKARAMEMMLLGDKIPAATALQWGLVNRCVPDEELIGAGRGRDRLQHGRGAEPRPCLRAGRARG